MPYDKAFINNMKRRLLEEKEGLMAQLEKISDKDPNVANDYDARYKDLGTERDENAQEVTEYQKNIGIENNLELMLQKVNAALLRIEEGTYGRCVNCPDQEVPRERLEAYPAADLCLTCQPKTVDPKKPKK